VVVFQPVVGVGLAILLGDVCRWPETPGVRGCSDHGPECHGTEVTRGKAPHPSSRGTEPRLTMAPGLGRVLNIVVTADPVLDGGLPRRKGMPSHLAGLGTLGPWSVRAVV
jgi:hypothetical protein